MNEAIASAIQKAGGQTALAKALGVTQGSVWQWLNGREVSMERCWQIEQVTAGEVRCEALNPGLPWVRGADGRVLIDVTLLAMRMAA